MSIRDSGDDSAPDFEDVRTILDADFQHLEHELEELYDDIERYAKTASVLESAGDSQDAEYHRELAVDTYESFVTAIQLKKDAKDYEF